MKPDFTLTITVIILGLIASRLLRNILTMVLGRLDHRLMPRECRNCKFSFYNGIAHICQHHGNRGAILKGNGHCPLFTAYNQPEEREVITNYLNRCLQESSIDD